MKTLTLKNDSTIHALCEFLDCLARDIESETNAETKFEYEGVFVNLVELLYDGKHHSSGYFGTITQNSDNPLMPLQDKIDSLKRKAIEFSK